MIIIARKSGSMGNRLFTFAHFIANSLEHGQYKVFNPVFDEYSSYFRGTSNQWVTCFPPSPSSMSSYNILVQGVRKAVNYCLYALTNPLRKDRIAWLHSPFHEVIDLHHPDEYDWSHTEFLQFVHKKIVTTNGWIFWDHEAFIRQAQILREYFRPVSSIENRLQQYIAECRSTKAKLIGVHIRHGDYRNHCDGRYFYPIERYSQLMQRLCSLHNGPVRFLVCSDESISIGSFPGLDVNLGPGTAVEDMYSLASCDYIVGPPSTFSGWASFWGKVPLYYIENMDEALQTVAFKDFFPLNSFDYRSPSFRYQNGTDLQSQ